MENQIIAKIKKSALSEIWVTKDSYQGKKRINIREYFKPEGETEYFPTRKGISVGIEYIEKILWLIESLKQSDDIGTSAELELSDKYMVVAGKREFAKRKYNEIRIYYWNDEKNEWLPSPKGVTFKDILIFEIKDALELARSSVI